MNNPASKPILNITDLSVTYQQGDQKLEAVRDVSLQINSGETYGLAGESGSGKTTLVLAVMRYLGSTGSISSGDIHLGDLNLRSLDEQELRNVWGRKIAFVPQDPQSALNPSLQVGEQLAEVLRRRPGLTEPEVKRQSIDWLHKIHLPDPERVAASYPHQISGGMQQRVLIAMALSTSPSLLVLDEPTTNLDVTTQAVILELISELIQGHDMAVLYITHNLGVISQYSDRVGVMYAGELVEEAESNLLFSNPLHPYTLGLLDSIPRMGDTKDRLQLRPISGQIPPIGRIPSGCVFGTRCPIAIEICSERPPLYTSGESRASRCHRWQEIEQGEINAHQEVPAAAQAQIGTPGDVDNTLEIENLSISFPIQRSLGEVLSSKPARAVNAVNEVNLEIPPGTTLGLVGESGSGKTTIARSIMGLQKKKNGSIKLHQIELPDQLSKRELDVLRQLQIVFQNPGEALNPHLTIGETLRRPFIRLLGFSSMDAQKGVKKLLAAVHLPFEYVNRFPGQLSGGEIQRIALARAIASNPDLLILDEPISSLDVSVQAAILNLVGELQGDHHNSLLFISHNLAIVGYLANQTAVIYVGNLMELSGQGDLFKPPHHPYTEALISAIPQIDRDSKGTHIHLEGEIPDPTDIPYGCPFHTRCPRIIGDICAEKIPDWQVDPTTNKSIFCHIPLAELSAAQVQMVVRNSK
jgi:peptide/nickel transport system ATP-binding protein